MSNAVFLGDVVASPAVDGSTIVILAVTAIGVFIMLSVMAYVRKHRKK